MISYAKALDLLESAATELGVESISSLNALERICAQDIFSPIALPSFDNSAMDGFAVCYNDTLSASEASPLELRVTEIIQAKASALKFAVAEAGCCCEIMTGAPIPTGYDAIIPIELVKLIERDGQNYIQIKHAVKMHDNVRFSGEDVGLGALLFKRGQQIQANDVMLLASVGIVKLNVFKALSLAIATTGEEISDNYAQELQHGEIYNSNAPLLMNLAAQRCFAPRYAGILRDHKTTLQEFIQTSSEQILITTGAVSKGKWDFIPDTLRELGAEIIFHAVAIRPGKPVLFARLKDGRFFFGLPGNPVSSMVGWRFFVIPLLCKMLAKEREIGIKLRLEHPFKKKHSLRQFLKARLSIQDGLATAQISHAQESFKIHSLTTNDLWAIALEDDLELCTGDLINVVPMYASFK